jgi:hypothetical protein
MKNKNNKTADELVDMILEVRKKQDGTSTRYAYATGVLIALIDGARSMNDLQEQINSSYESYEKELQTLKLKDLQKVANKAKLEELYA